MGWDFYLFLRNYARTPPAFETEQIDQIVGQLLRFRTVKKVQN
jgi:hypothetical protein